MPTLRLLVLCAWLLLFLAGCQPTGLDQIFVGAVPSPGSQDAPRLPAFLSALPGRLLVQTEDQRLVAQRPDGSEALQLAAGSAGPGRSVQLQQATWSPTGELVAWSETVTRGQSVSGRLVTGAPDGSRRTEASVILPPFYISWSPDGRRVTYLSNWPTGGLVLRMVDLDAGGENAVTLMRGGPLYYSWAGNGLDLLTHVGGRDVSVLSLDGAVTRLSDRGGTFAAPQWSSDDQSVFYVVQDQGPGAPRRQVGYSLQPQNDQTLVRADLNGRILEDLFPFSGAVNFTLSPDNRHMAFVVTEAPAAFPTFGVLHIMDLESRQVISAVPGPVMAFFWSPDGRRLLYLTSDSPGVVPSLRWNLWDGTAHIPLSRFEASPLFLRNYLPFFDQYAQSLRFWSPDGSAFVYSGRPGGPGESEPWGIWVQSVAGAGSPVRVADGLFATWSPQ